MNELREDLDPDMVQITALLEEHGFQVVDAVGDHGEHCECERKGPYITVATSSDYLFADTRSIHRILCEHGFVFRSSNKPSLGTDIFGTLYPAEDLAIIDIIGVSDAMLIGTSKEAPKLLSN